MLASILVRKVLEIGYQGLNFDTDYEELNADPFLISHALMFPNERTVVTNEVSKPKKQGKNRKIPDVCNSLNVLSCDIFSVIKTLDFKTSWND